MLVASLQVPSGGSIISKLPFRKVRLRRIVITAPNDSVYLTYNGFVDLKFESYYGFPNASKFAFINYSTTNTDIVVLADCIPESIINNDYFEVQTS